MDTAYSLTENFASCSETEIKYRAVIHDAVDSTILRVTSLVGRQYAYM
jgi:hypothetical protein